MKVGAEIFEALFRESVRSVFNWHALRREKWPVTVETVTTRADLGKLYLPWVKSGELFDVGAKSVQLRGIPAALPELDEKRRSKILSLAAHFSAGDAPVLLVPAVPRRRRGTYLVLDVCHRLAALMLAGDVHVCLFVVQAPADAATIVDLELAR